MTPVLKNGLCRGLYHSGLLRLTMALKEPRRGASADGHFQILVYHRVGPAPDPFMPALPASVFENHVRYLRKHFRVLSLTELLRAVAERQLPARAIAITFDDGYEDVYRHVFPIVCRVGVPITVFLATGFIDGEQPMWNDRIAAAIRDTTCEVLSDVPDVPPLPLTTLRARQEAVMATLGALKYRPLKERDELVERIANALQASSYQGPGMLRWSQVGEMHKAGVEFGAHTVRHPILTSQSAAERWDEIVDSKRVIEEKLQSPALHFAYPNGTERDFDDLTKGLLRKAGFSSAVTMVFGVNTPATDAYELRRGGPWEEQLSLFATKLWWYRREQPRELRHRTV